MLAAVQPQSVSVSIRRSADGSEVSLPWERATSAVLAEARPWRTFRSHKGQRHFPGIYWSTCEGQEFHVDQLQLGTRRGAAGPPAA
jgi:hypothetical protein